MLDQSLTEIFALAPMWGALVLIDVFLEECGAADLTLWWQCSVGKSSKFTGYPNGLLTSLAGISAAS
jgi:hypothetical protein